MSALEKLKQNQPLLDVLAMMNVPEWATHIAVRDEVPKIGMAIYLEEGSCFIDEDPAASEEPRWASSYDERYWEIIPLADFGIELSANAEDLTLEQAEEMVSKLEIGDRWATHVFVKKDGTRITTAQLKNELTEKEIEFYQSHVIQVRPFATDK